MYNDRKLIAIHLDNPTQLIITLQLTTSCTYACRYCPEELHTKTHSAFDLEELRNFFSKFSGRDILMTLTGGEVTTHPQFKQVTSLAKSLGIKVLVDTNAVRTVRFFQEVKSLADVWNITLHPSQHTLDLEKIRVLTNDSFVVVYVMMDPDYWDAAISWWNSLQGLVNLKIIPLRTISNWNGAKFEALYTPEQEQWLLNTKAMLRLTKERETELMSTHSWMLNTESTAVFDDGVEEKLDAYVLLKEQANNFNGWACSAGCENILINSEKIVSWANCGMKKYKLSEMSLEDLDTPVICNKDFCNCVTDIRSTKYKN